MVVVMTLALELKARGEALGGGLARLQMDSVAVWVLESLPFLIAGAAAAIAAGGVPLGRVARSTVEPEPVPSAPPRVPQVKVEPPAPAAPPSPDPAPSRSEVAEPSPVETDQRVRALQELARVLKANVARATKDSRAKSALLAALSDELRAPLNTILGHTETLAERSSEEGLDIDASVAEVSEAAHRLAAVVNNLLDLAKIDMGTLSIVLEDVDVAQVVEEVQASMGSRRGPGIAVTIADDARFTRGDHMRVRQIVTNVVDEVSRHPSDRPVPLKVARTAASQGAWVSIEVRDPGTVLSDQELERAFDPFHAQSSAGLGMSIARRLAELMGGRLEVSADPETGTTYTLVLPPSVSTPAEAPPVRSQVALNERLSGLELVLLDASTGGPTLGRYLQKAGLEVTVCEELPELRIALEQSVPSVAVVDVADAGWTAAEDLLGRGVPVVVMSLRDEDVERSLQLGVTAFLTRPVDRKLLLATLERCLDGGH
ncbi:MAG: hypothetical protein KTR31_03035 [Myxococcales bacterium]|nr:hypothetical protein [Myxococcales bacterium]